MASLQAETIAPNAGGIRRGQKGIMDCRNELESQVVIFECCTESGEWKIISMADPAAEKSPFCSLSSWIADDLWDMHFDDILLSKD